MTIALSLMGDLPVGHIERAFVHNQVDHLLVIAKAIGLSWETTRAILVMRDSRESNESSADRKIGMHRNSFIRLQQSTAVSALQFYRLRARAEAQLETPP
jgi:hypothetical protein